MSTLSPKFKSVVFIYNSAYLCCGDSSKDLIGVAIFESKEHHIKNAESAEQNKAFEKMMEFLASEPTWTDGVFPIGEIA